MLGGSQMQYSQNNNNNMKSTLSPSRSTIGLTSQQKDLVIIHLKSEVYELKQSENDYKSLLHQVQQLEDRLKYLKDEKDIALRDYQSKVTTQEKQIDMAKRELDEFQRINGNKDTDNMDTLTKIKSDKNLLKNTDQDYKSLRDQNDHQITLNKHLKDEIAQIEDQLTEEKRRQVELRAVKDKLSHQLYRGADDSDQLVEKEQECIRRLREKENEQQIREERLRLIEKELAEKENHFSHARTQQASDQTRAVQVKNSLQLQEDENHRLEDQQKRMREQLHLENIKQEELQTRVREINHKISRRDEENDQIVNELRHVDRDVELLKEKYENLVLERNALREHSERIIDANKEVEKELDSFVNLDDSIVRTLEKRDNNLSPVISQYKPHNQTQYNPMVQSIGSNYQGGFGLQQSRMFDLQSAEQIKISPYSKTYGDPRNGNVQHYQNSQMPNQLNPVYQSQQRLHDMYYPQTATKQFDQSHYEDPSNRRVSAGETLQSQQQLYQSTYAKDTGLIHSSSSLKFLKPHTLNNPNNNDMQRENSNKYLSVTQLDRQRDNNSGFDRRKHSPLRQNII
eukprot:403369796